MSPGSIVSRSSVSWVALLSSFGVRYALLIEMSVMSGTGAR
jgi:hypothetical protein